jgi:hypothetical protein
VVLQVLLRHHDHRDRLLVQRRLERLALGAL